MTNDNETCPCRTITKYHSCCCYFDFLIEIIMPGKKHVCPSKIIRKLKESPSGNDATVWNDKRTSLSVVCKKCIGAFFLSGRYVKSWYFNNERTHYYTIPSVKNYVKKFDKTGAKIYSRKNSYKFLPLILAQN